MKTINHRDTETQRKHMYISVNSSVPLCLCGEGF